MSDIQERGPTENVPLITKYRPARFKDVIGHDAAMGPLLRALDGSARPHAYLLTGPAGTGKTSLARLIAAHVEADTLEIPAAVYNGVDAMRELVEQGSYMSLQGDGARLFILDECHTYTKPAWQALLKILEEPPAHLFFALCTTEADKVPETIKTRCYHVSLRPISPRDMEDLLLYIAEAEGWEVADDTLAAVVEAATGQPRKGIAMLQSVHDVKSREEVQRIISLNGDSDALHDLCGMMFRGNTPWKEIQKALAEIPDEDFASASVMMGRYFMGVMQKATEDKAQKAWRLLDALLFPTSGFDGKASFYAALGRIRWGD